jgi:hypothetical protein
MAADKVGAIDDPVWVSGVEKPPGPKLARKLKEQNHRYGVVVGALLVLMAFVLGYLGWVLPSAGGSLVVPTLIVFGIGCVFVVALAFLTGSLGVALMAMGVVAVASLWTFSFSIPASLTWGSGATSHAEAALAQLSSSPQTIKGVYPPHPCSIVRTGTVGPIDAPYRMCSVFTPEGHFVTFTSVGHSEQGLGYTDVGASTFEDECSRHVVGKWWMFNARTNGLGSCPIGYQFHGGG